MMIVKTAAVLAALAAGCAALAMAQTRPATPAAQQDRGPEPPPPDMSDEASEGINEVRIENEMKINVPDSVVEAVWQYLNRRYLPRPTFLEENGARYGARASEEFFTDVYYDTPDLWFLRNDNGLRHRSRVIPGDVANRKNGRELMQIKLQRVGEVTSRSEIKFQIRHYARSRRRPDDSKPALGIVRRSDRPAFLARLAELGVDGNNLRHAITIEQRRRRIYVFDEAGIFMSLTLDQTSTKKWWLRQGFTEIELEINEIAYTGASHEKRRFLEQLNEQVRQDLVRAFPMLTQDQTPKYSKMIAGFAAMHPWFPMVFRMSMSRSFAAMVGSIALLVVFGAAFLVVRRRKPRTTRPWEAAAPGDVQGRFVRTGSAV